MRMSADWPEQHTAERAAEGKKPVAQSSGHRAGRASDEVGNHNPHLLDEERRADQAVRVQVVLDARLRKERRAGGSDEIRRDPDETLGSGRQEIGLQPTAEWGAPRLRRLADRREEASTRGPSDWRLPLGLNISGTRSWAFATSLVSWGSRPGRCR